MQVSGDAAKEYYAVRLDSFATVNAGLLLFADDQTGEVRWTDKSGEAKSLTLGPHMISIQKAGR